MSTEDETTINFMGVLSNVDSSILKVDFGNDFKIVAFSEKETIRLFRDLENISENRTFEKYLHNLHAFNESEHKIYAICKSFEGSSEILPNIFDWDNKFVNPYLENRIRSMRLFKEGDIRMPVKFYYTDEKSKIEQQLSYNNGKKINFNLFHIEESEISDLEKFIQSAGFPFKKDFLNLAFENFELSYEVPNFHLAFLVLMIGLETLFNPSNGEVKHRVSRNTAVFLGESEGDSKDIFNEIKSLYDKRSSLVHSGNRKEIVKEDALKLRGYLRKAINEAYSLGKEKEDLLAILNMRGFGDKTLEQTKSNMENKQTKR